MLVEQGLSSPARIARIAIWAFAFASAWTALIQFWRPSITQTQNQYAGNLQEAQAFLYGDTPDAPLVVGSSMAEFMDILSAGRLAELSMNGMSAREALEVVVRSGRVPARIAVEVNGLSAPYNQAFIDHLFAPGFIQLRRYVLAFRAEYQPASVIMTLAKQAFGQRRTESEWGAPSHDFVKLRIEHLKKHYRTGPNMSILMNNLQAVRRMVATLEERGANVMYYELPVPHGLADTPFHVLRREATNRILGQGRSTAIFHFPDDEYETKDGIHLTRQGQHAVANRLADVLTGAEPGQTP